MKISLAISNFPEEISSLSHSVVFLYFFFCIDRWGRLSYLSLLFFETAFGCLYLSFSPLPFTSLLFTAICNPLVSLIFLKRSLFFPILLFSSISLHWLLRKALLSLLAILWNSAFKWVYLSFSPLSPAKAGQIPRMLNYDCLWIFVWHIYNRIYSFSLIFDPSSGYKMI